MSPIRYRDENPSIGGIIASITAGAVAGFAVGVVVAQKMGGLSGIAARISRRFPDDDGSELHHGYGEDDLEELQADSAMMLEEEVLDAFENDPVLSERAIDIASVGTGVIELSGWVRNEAESRRAEAVTRRVTGVDAVVNRLSSEDDVDTQPPERDDEIRENEETDEPLPGGQWQGQRVGTGRRRQGNSAEADRHSDPKPPLESRWLDKQHAIEEAAGDIEGIAERWARGKKSAAKGDRTGGAPEAPTGVPKADHVVNPEAAPPTQSAERPENGPA